MFVPYKLNYWLKFWEEFEPRSLHTQREFDRAVERSPEKDVSTSWAAFVFRGWRKLKTLKRHALAKSPSQNSFQPNEQIPSRYAELKFVPNGAWHPVSADFFAMYRASTVLQRKRKEYFRILISNISLAISDVYHWTGKHGAKLPLSRNQIRNNSLHLTRLVYLGPVQTTCSNRTFTEFN